jgi:hypothetical protein
MIVNVTRGDLRDEFSMANEAFALSPISARAAQPSEEDYDAISEAFMETARGRWFLGEYAKRNRNADTRMVLDAVERIEQSLAAQKQPAAEPDNGLAEALAAIRTAVGEARSAATVALDGLALEETLAPIRKGARIIREISWRWREIGADGRICDLLDSQVSSIEASCGQISSIDPLPSLGAAFDLIEQRIAEFDDGENPVTETAETIVSSPPPAPSEEMLAAIAETFETTTATDSVEALVSVEALDSAPAMSSAPAVAAAAAVEAAAEVTAEAAETIAEAAPEAADDYEDAMLDMVALEMAAPDFSEGEDILDADGYEIERAELPPAEPGIALESPEFIIAAAEPLPPVGPPTAQPPPEAPPEISLGSSLIANGIVRKPATSISDPLAPIRRMSQAEKVALFS